MIDLFSYENSYLQCGCKLIAGVDEAGRGSLAGPVVSAAVIMPLDKIIVGINDSKKLSIKKREYLYLKIVDEAIDFQISAVDNKIVDEVNILNATKISMQNCINGLQLKPDIVLIDAVKLNNENANTLSIIHGDMLSYSIAAASILAKVFRDNLMKEYDKIYPLYNFKQHKGYGTQEHIALIKQYGICEIHRKTFVKNFI